MENQNNLPKVTLENKQGTGCTDKPVTEYIGEYNNNQHDAVYKPSHYEKDGYPSTQVMVRAMFAGTQGKLPLSVYPWWKDAFKYIFRWPLKNGVEDLRKAQRCIDMIIEELEATND